jgi:hypothetical protein
MTAPEEQPNIEELITVTPDPVHALVEAVNSVPNIPPHEAIIKAEQISQETDHSFEREALRKLVVNAAKAQWERRHKLKPFESFPKSIRRIRRRPISSSDAPDRIEPNEDL